VPDIVLSTLNAKYLHASFGLRCLLANLGDLRGRATILEFDINQRPLDIAEALLAAAPRILGLGVYVWNVTPTLELVGILRRLRPDLVLVLGGPEVSHEWDRQPIIALADHVITGEADLAFAALCRDLLSGSVPRPPKLIAAPVPDVAALAQPYDLYDDRDLEHRVVYVEASRGCPFTCEFCLSSLDIPVRQFPLEPFLAEMDRLHARGLRRFKFVDRTFNLNVATGRRILGFFLERLSPELFVHFEMIPDRLPAELRELIARFPAGTLQFEVGIQTFDREVESRISRRQNHDRLTDNFQWLRRHSGVHLHADFDKLSALRPHEIQFGILKRLRGAPISRHTENYGLVFDSAPPYQILATDRISFPTMQRLVRFARYWDLVANSGRFADLMPALLGETPFARFLALSDWLYQNTDATYRISPERLRLLLDRWLGQDTAEDEHAGRALNTESRALTSATQRQQRHQDQQPQPLQAALPSAEVRQASISKRASSPSEAKGTVRARSKIISA